MILVFVVILGAGLVRAAKKSRFGWMMLWLTLAFLFNIRNDVWLGVYTYPFGWSVILLSLGTLVLQYRRVPSESCSKSLVND